MAYTARSECGKKFKGHTQIAKHQSPMEFVNGIPMEQYRKENPLSAEGIEENRLGLLKDFAPSVFEEEMKKAKTGNPAVVESERKTK